MQRKEITGKLVSTAFIWFMGGGILTMFTLYYLPEKVRFWPYAFFDIGLGAAMLALIAGVVSLVEWVAKLVETQYKIANSLEEAVDSLKELANGSAANNKILKHNQQIADEIRGKMGE